jgi:hypothetical protein
MELKYFTPILRWLSVVADKPDVIGGDEDIEPDTRGIFGGVTVTPGLTASGGDTRAVRAEDLDPSPALLALAPFEARLDDGNLMLTADQRLRLLARCDVLELPPGVDLTYRFDFHDVTYNQQPQILPSITIPAPYVPNDHDDDLGGEGENEIEVDLATVSWLEDGTTSGVNLYIQRLPDDVTLVGDDVQFWAGGEPLGDPLDLTVTGGGGGGSGDMIAATYDPTAVEGDAFDRANHHGTQSADSLVDGATNHVFTAADDTKLAGIATNATANATNAELRDRATHTGLQTSATISDFTEAVQDAVAALLAAGTAISLSYDDAGNSLTITGTGGGGGGLDAEGVRDAIGVALLGSGLISVTVNDALDTITISTTATQNSTDAALRDRSTHTGTQAISTITETAGQKIMTDAERTKLAGIATNATANDTDANLKNRANHTGTQASSTISDLTETVQDLVAALLVGGSGISLSYDDGAGTLTVNGPPGASGSYSALIGNGVLTDIPITHNLGTTAVAIATYDVATGEEVDCDPFITGINTATIKFAVAPAASSIRVVVIGGAVMVTPGDGTVTAAKIAAHTIPYDVSYPQTLGTRATGLGQNKMGVKLQRAVRFTSVTYRVETADASGNLTVELRKNGSAVSGSSATIAAASQVAGGTATGSWDFAAGDILTVNVTAVGTTPGTGLIADITGAAA